MVKYYELQLACGKSIFLNQEDLRAKTLIETKGNFNTESKLTWKYLFQAGSWDYILDVGSNYGEMIVCLDIEQKTKVICFEANPELSENYLKKSIENLGNKNITVINVALGSENNDEVNFFIDEQWSGTSGLSKQSSMKLHGGVDRTKSIKVHMSTLDHEVDLSDASALIKIDVEGSERDVLLGAINSLKKCKSCIIMFESLHLDYHGLLDFKNLFPEYTLLTHNIKKNTIQKIPLDSEIEFKEFKNNSSFNHQDYILSKNTRIDTHHSQEIKGNRYAVYTALIGADYEELNKDPFPFDNNCDYICFTDIPNLSSEKWNFIQVTPYFPRDKIRSARYLKIMGPLLLGNYEASLWIDNSVSIKKPASEIIEDWLSDTDIALPDHSFRLSIAAEFDAVDYSGFDDPSRIYEQLIAYANSDSEVLLEKPYWTAILARRHTDKIFSFLLRWWSHVLRYSRRDQLSFNYAAKEEKIHVKRIIIDNNNSDLHVWPAIKNRNRKLTSESISSCLRIPFMDLGKLHNALTNQELIIRHLSNEIETLKNK